MDGFSSDRKVEPRPTATSLGVVAIGRNEGERLRLCLASVLTQCPLVVYVDSGSTDGSVALARRLGAHVVELDATQPFTAARARNAGLARLLELAPQAEYVQFVDGDCELVAGWLAQARAALESDCGLVAVTGRRRERHREATIYNRVTDMMDWDRAPGEAKAVGGDAMFRVDALRAVGGFNPSVIAGEEPELCVRLRRAGGRILRLQDGMTWHDVGMIHFRQWWKRSVRAGHSYIEGALRHGFSKEVHFVRESLSLLFWGGLPILAFALAWPTGGHSLWSLLLYPAQWLRLFGVQVHRGRSGRDARAFATFILLAKFAQLVGALTLLFNLARGKRTRLIEYKPVSTSLV
jgi:GT2 family glycosyltransferase